jgi:hypothetical protein
LGSLHTVFMARYSPPLRIMTPASTASRSRSLTSGAIALSNAASISITNPAFASSSRISSGVFTRRASCVTGAESPTPIPRLASAGYASAPQPVHGYRRSFDTELSDGGEELARPGCRLRHRIVGELPRVHPAHVGDAQGRAVHRVAVLEEVGVTSAGTRAHRTNVLIA